MSTEKLSETRERVLAAAADLLAEGGREAMSTRAVGAAAGIQAPTLYRLFGDKQGLVDAVIGYGFERYLADKQALPPSQDPVQDLRRGWDLHVDFGLTHPSFYALMYGTVRPGEPPAAAAKTYQVLLGVLERVAQAGRLRVPVEKAAQMIQAASVGVALALISTPAQDRDTDLSVRTRETVVAAVTTDPAPPTEEDATLTSHAIALEAALPAEPDGFTAAETLLLKEWLHRLASS